MVRSLKSIQRHQLREIQQLVELPDGEIEEEWIAYNLFEIIEFTKLLGEVLLGKCACQSMSAGSGFDYMWIDSEGQQMQITAAEYIQNVIGFATEQLQDPQVFPIAPGVPFPRQFRCYASQILRRILRIYIHYFLGHYDLLEDLQIREHFNSCILLIIQLAKRFQLIDAIEYQPIQDYAEMFGL